MKKWLSYIVMTVACGLYFSSCAKDDEVITSTDNGNVPVRLTLSLPGSTSRAIDSPVEDGALDPTTEEQSKINDVYVLVVDNSNNTLKYLVKDLKVSSSGSNYNQKVLEGTMLKTNGNERVKLVVLANLSQNNLVGVTTTIQAYLESMVGNKIDDIYNALIYKYTGPTPWKIGERGIPMWGTSFATSVPSQGLDGLKCPLYRAVAKVSVWINQKKGYQNINGDFTITSITVNNANNQGYCVSQSELNMDETIQYLFPYIDNLAMIPQTFEYTDLKVTEAYEDMIYLPEQVNTDNSAVTLTIHYTYNGSSRTGTIEFKKDGIGKHFDIVRNYVYVFNISLSNTPAGVTFQYQAMPWVDKSPVDIEFN